MKCRVELELSETDLHSECLTIYLYSLCFSLFLLKRKGEEKTFFFLSNMFGGVSGYKFVATTTVYLFQRLDGCCGSIFSLNRDVSL